MAAPLSARAIRRRAVRCLDERASYVAKFGAELDIEPPAFPLADGNEVMTTFIENRRKLFLHLLYVETPAPHTPRKTCRARRDTMMVHWRTAGLYSGSRYPLRGMLAATSANGAPAATQFTAHTDSSRDHQVR